MIITSYRSSINSNWQAPPCGFDTGINYDPFCSVVFSQLSLPSGTYLVTSGVRFQNYATALIGDTWRNVDCFVVNNAELYPYYAFTSTMAPGEGGGRFLVSASSQPSIVTGPTNLALRCAETTQRAGGKLEVAVRSATITAIKLR